MAKTIKFNLKLDNRAVRDIKGLQENFCIEDMLEVYENGLLEKWLEVRKFDSYLTKVKKIDENDSVIVQLIKIFSITQDENKIREAIYALEFEENQKQELKKFQESKDDLKRVVSDYHKNYENLIKSILEKKENMAFLKEASREISDNYLKLFELDYKVLYKLLKEKAPLMVYAILMNEKLSFWFMKNKLIKKNLYENFIEQDKYDINELRKLNLHKKHMQDTLYTWQLISSEPVLIIGLSDNHRTWIDISENSSRESEFNARNSIGKVFKSLYFNSYAGSDYVEYIKISDLPTEKKYKEIIKFKGVTDNYWKDVETSEAKIMILSIPNGTFITNPDNQKKEYSSKEVNGNFLIMDGLLYKSNILHESIVYMKV